MKRVVRAVHLFSFLYNICCIQGNVCEGGGYIVSVVIFSFLFNLSKFLEFQTVYMLEVEEDNSR